MKKLAIALATVALLACTVSCKDNSTTAPAGETKALSADAAAAPQTLNIRYIDGDSLTAKYNLAKDFTEQNIKAYARFEDAQRSKASQIMSLQGQIEQKMQNNGYLTQESYEADMNKLAKMQSDAQSQLANMQRSLEQEMAQRQIELNDSVESFIKEYNKDKGYDAILFKSAGVYFNPALDITDEVVDGLNARYNKVPAAK